MEKLDYSAQIWVCDVTWPWKSVLNKMTVWLRWRFSVDSDLKHPDKCPQTCYLSFILFVPEAHWISSISVIFNLWKYIRNIYVATLQHCLQSTSVEMQPFIAQCRQKEWVTFHCDLRMSRLLVIRPVSIWNIVTAFSFLRSTRMSEWCVFCCAFSRPGGGKIITYFHLKVWSNVGKAAAESLVRIS